MMNLENTFAKLGKISNNLEKHGNDDVTAFDVPVVNVMIDAAIVNAFSGDKHFDRRIFDTDRQGVKRKAEGLRKFGPLRLLEKFEGAHVDIEVTGDRVVSFDQVRIKNVTVDGHDGGLVELCFTMTLIPGLGEANLILQEYQNHEVKISVRDAKVETKKKSQQLSLPMNDRAPGGDEGGNEGGNDPDQGVPPEGSNPLDSIMGADAPSEPERQAAEKSNVRSLKAARTRQAKKAAAAEPAADPVH